jgi:hypothetical protein
MQGHAPQPSVVLKPLLLRMTLAAIALGVLAAAGASALTDQPRAGAAAAFGAFGVWLSGVVSLAPVARASRRAEPIAGAWLLGMGIRVVLSLGLAIAGGAAGGLPLTVTLVATAATYFPMCMLEATLIARAMRRRLPNTAGGPGAASQENPA